MENYSWKLSIVKNRRKKQVWEIFIIFIALYSVLVIPIRIGVNATLWDPYYDYIDLVTWLIYVTDVFVNLRTTYIDSFGHEVVQSKKIAMRYVASARFYIDILSLVNLPNIMLSGVSTTTTLVLNALGLLKLARYFRAQDLIVQSRLRKDVKAEASCLYYFVLLVIYLHVMGCLFFLACLTTYNVSTFKLTYMEELALVEKNETDGKLYGLNGEEDFIAQWNQATEAVKAKQEWDDYNPQIFAWVPAYDNYDGTEKFWRMYELSRLSQENMDTLEEKNILTDLDHQNGHWLYIWGVCIYYSVLVIGGNEMQPAQELELIWVVVMNISGLIFITWISGEIAVLIGQLSSKQSGIQQEIDVMNTAMKNAKLSFELQTEIRDYFLKVQGTM